MTKQYDIEVLGYGLSDQAGEVAIHIACLGSRYDGELLIQISSLPQVELSPQVEQTLSLIEIESTGQAAPKVCERLNRNFAGQNVSIPSMRDASAIERLFELAKESMDFHLRPLTPCKIAV